MQRNIILRSKIAFAVREQLTSAGLPRNRNAVHDALHAGRRARLPGAQPRAARHVLCAAAIAADLQAAPDGQRLRKVLPDRPLLPRRRPARRPPARVHPDRSRDVLPAAGAPSSTWSSPWCRKSAKWPGTRSPRPSRASPTPQAMRDYGIDKPDMPHSADAPGGRPACRNWPMPACRWWRFTFPACGAPSRKERDEFKAFGQERGLRVFDDPKRLERDYPEQMAKVRERCGAKEDEPAGAGRVGRRTQGPSSRRDRLSGLRPVAPALRRRSSTTATSCSTRRISSSSGWSISPCSSGTKKRTAGSGAPSVHLGARRGPRNADRRSGALPRQVLRPGVERHRTGLRLDSYSPPRRAGEGLRRRSASPTTKRAAASATCWTRWNTARRRTAESRWGWTAW